jgi:rhodanese-related sulfurtransferase
MTIIDVRSPAEFAEDHIPGAINCPVLDNEQRIQVGTLYKQVSPFEAKKIGAALVSENIARHLRAQLSRPPEKLETADLLLARRRPQRLDDHRVSRPSAGMPANSTAVTKPGAAMSSPSLTRIAGAVRVHRSSAAPPAVPRRASCRPSARWASRCWISKRWPATKARSSASCPASRSRPKRV